MRGVTDFDPITAVGSLALILTVQVLLHVLLSKQLVRLSESVVRDLRSEAFGLMLETNGSRKADSGEADFVVLVLSRELGANLAAVLFGAGNGVLLFALFFWRCCRKLDCHGGWRTCRHICAFDYCSGCPPTKAPRTSRRRGGGFSALFRHQCGGCPFGNCQPWRH